MAIYQLAQHPLSTSFYVYSVELMMCTRYVVHHLDVCCLTHRQNRHRQISSKEQEEGTCPMIAMLFVSYDVFVSFDTCCKSAVA